MADVYVYNSNQQPVVHQCQVEVSTNSQEPCALEQQLMDWYRVTWVNGVRKIFRLKRFSTKKKSKIFPLNNFPKKKSKMFLWKNVFLWKLSSKKKQWVGSSRFWKSLYQSKQ